MTKTLVVDASYVLAFLLPDERGADVDKLFDQLSSGSILFVSTQLLHFEVHNALKAAIIQKRLTRESGYILAKAFIDLPITIEPVDYEGVFDLSLQRKISVYDAAYLYLSKAKAIRLMTLDKDLIGVN